MGVALCVGVLALPAHAQGCDWWFHGETYGGYPYVWQDISAAEVKACLKAGKDPNARTRRVWRGSTLLHLAAGSNENPEVIIALLDGGADPNARREDGFTPLHDAALFSKTPEVIKALLDGGADPNTQAEYGEAPLHYAVSSENPEVIITLLYADANPRARTADGQTPFELIPDDSPLHGTEAYWQLHDSQYD